MKIPRGHGCSPFWWNLAYLSFLHLIMLQVLLLTLKTQTKSINSAELSRCIFRSQIILPSAAMFQKITIMARLKRLIYFLELYTISPIGSCIVEVVKSLNNSNNKGFSAVVIRYSLSPLWNNMTLVHASLRQTLHPILNYLCVNCIASHLDVSYFPELIATFQKPAFKKVFIICTIIPCINTFRT